MKNIDVFKKRALFVFVLLAAISLCSYSYAGYAARVKTWSSGQTLTASDLNAEFDNILDNGVGVTTTQTLTNKTLTTPIITVPTITDFSSSTHDHNDATGGGTLTLPVISNFSSATHDHSDNRNGGSLAATVFGNYSIAASGYQHLPSGLVVQWGTVSQASRNQETDIAVTFPEAFDTACLHANAIVWTAASAANSDNTANLFSVSTTGATFRMGSWVGGTQTYGLYWFAIGY